jgi:hypothetical protein
MEKKPKSNGQIFKEKNGFSKTMKRNMQKHNLDIIAFSDSLNEYRAIRKKRKKKELESNRKVKPVRTTIQPSFKPSGKKK